MSNSVKSKSMFLLLPLLAACSGEDTGTKAAVSPILDTPVAAQGIVQPSGAVVPLTDFEVWAQRLMADRISPVVAGPGDLTQVWVGADDRLASVVVLNPRTAGKATVSVDPPANGADATPVLQAAVAQLRKGGGGVLKIAAGEYRFKSGNTEQPGLAHLLLSRLADVDIQGAGARFTFEGNIDGILVQDCKRLRISGVRMRDARRIASTGRMRLIDGTMTLVLDRAVPADTAIHWVQAMNEGNGTWPYVTSRAIINPTMTQPTRVDDRSFTSPEFRTLKDGQYVAVKHSFYGARAVYVRDSYTGGSDDIVLDGIRIASSAGMGVLVKMRGRGFALQNSTLMAEPGEAYSTNYDGLHLVAAGGDILVRGNTMKNVGDDPINLRSLIHKATPVGTDSATLTNDARFIRAGDEVAFFNRAGEYLGKRIVASAPPIGSSDTITFTFKPGEPFSEAAFARTINLTPRRFAIVDNTLADAPGRGMLVQIPIGLIQNNVLRRFPRTAIRLLTSFDPWLEGAGAINVRVAGNTIDDGGAETGQGYVTGIITAIGEAVAGKLPPNLFNGPIKIEGNTFLAPRAACIVVYNTKGLVQQNNDCGSA